MTVSRKREYTYVLLPPLPAGHDDVVDHIPWCYYASDSPVTWPNLTLRPCCINWGE